MKTTFITEQPGKIYLDEDVRKILKVKLTDVFYIHIKKSQILLNRKSKNAYSAFYTDDEYCIYMGSEILLYKLMKKPGETIDAIVHSNKIIIPLTPEQSAAKIQYVRHVIKPDYTITIPKYIRQKMDLCPGIKIQFIFKGNNWMIKKDPNGSEIIHEFNDISLPNELRKYTQIEFIIKNHQLILKPFHQ